MLNFFQLAVEKLVSTLGIFADMWSILPEKIGIPIFETVLDFQYREIEFHKKEAH